MGHLFTETGLLLSQKKKKKKDKMFYDLLTLNNSSV